MARHLKSNVISRLNVIVDQYIQLPPKSAKRARGVRYLTFTIGIDAYWGTMNDGKEGRHYNKHIIVRHAPERNGLFQLYTYHFPTHWSEACVANRERIKQAQRMAHDLEHAHTREALEWRLRFWHHYFSVFKGGAKPEPGMKPYSRFYQYTFVAIYRQLQAARQQEPLTCENLSFEPVDERPASLHTLHRYRNSLTAHFIPSLARRNDPLQPFPHPLIC